MSSFGEMIQFNSKLTEDELDMAVGFFSYAYSNEVMHANLEHYKFPSGLLDDMIPEEFTTVFDMVDDAAEYGVYTISDQAFPQELMVSWYQVQDQLALGELTPEQAAQFMKEATETYVASQ
jgi:raffinose/stachyose/melibiose transport system substrate-binding protein